ncbi:hypothetical protein C2E23DRAFT_921390, partial [Lenzites betulinus]
MRALPTGSVHKAGLRRKSTKPHEDGAALSDLYAQTMQYYGALRGCARSLLRTTRASLSVVPQAQATLRPTRILSRTYLRPHPAMARKRGSFARREIRLCATLRQLMAKAIAAHTGNKDAFMRWTVRGYHHTIYTKYGLEVVGCPEDIPFANLRMPGLTGLRRVSTLLGLWQTCKLCFVPASEPNRAARVAKDLLAVRAVCKLRGNPAEPRPRRYQAAAGTRCSYGREVPCAVRAERPLVGEVGERGGGGTRP